MDVIKTIRQKLYNAGLLPLRKQAELSEVLLRDRLDNLLPALMDECGVDMWFIAAYENNEDPVMKTMLTYDMRTARRLSAIMIVKNHETGKIERLTWGIPFPKMKEYYTPVKVGDESLVEGLARMIEKYQPRNIEVNIRGEYGGYCDGLSASLYESLKTLPNDWFSLVRPAERITTRWLETMTEGERKVMEVLVEVTEDIIKASYSRDVITPGVTTTADVEWFMRDVISQCELDFWFGPDIDLQRKGVEGYSFEGVIEEGDLIHCDIGVYLKYLPVLTDKQWMGYILRSGEAEAPAGVHALFAQGNRFQDISCEEYLAGRTGNDVFHKAVDRAWAEGLTPSLYCHGLGTFGHSAGPIIGRWDHQDSIYPRGEFPVGENTAYALELNIRGDLPEWDGQNVRISLEEDIFVAKAPTYVRGREEKIIEI
ncbi:MAG: M24 family metallopeptidase [Clostridia bacterium]|nr:M24 family metallopeptidase [Clostridia bacterium]